MALALRATMALAALALALAAPAARRHDLHAAPPAARRLEVDYEGYKKLAMEGNAELVHTMMTVCRERTLKKTHSGAELSASEKQEFQNCILKYFETPNHIMSAMQGMAANMQ